MKRTIKELDVDFVGGQGTLTAEEGSAISAYLFQYKLLKTSSLKSKSTTSGRNITLA